MTQDSLTIDSVVDIQKAYDNALSRLGLSQYSLEVEGDQHPIDLITHPHGLLARLAMKAEESAILMFGVRLFPAACYIVNNETPTGMILEHYDMLSPAQTEDRNIKESLRFPQASMNNLTAGLRDLLVDSSVVDTLEIDKAQKLVRIKPLVFVMQSLYRSGPRFENGQGLPLMSPEMIAINELQGLLLEDYPLIAMNKAREKAEELYRDIMKRKELANERHATGDYDASNS